MHKRKKELKRNESPLSSSLRRIGEYIQKQDFPTALERADELLGEASGVERSRVLSLVGDGEFKRGRFAEAAQIQLQAAAGSMSDSGLWLRAYIGEVRALLKVPRVELASMMARHAITLAETKMADFDEQVRLARQAVAENGTVGVSPVPPRVSVVATRMGYLFLQEGEPEVAEEFFLKAIQSAKGGANRARQGLAIIALAKGEFGIAINTAADAIRRGGYKAKTLPAWMTLIAARRQLGGWKISERLIKGLDSAPAGLRARTTLHIIRELRKNDMRQWQEVASRWIAEEGKDFPRYEKEICKLALSSAKSVVGDEVGKLTAAEQLLSMRILGPKDWLMGAKEFVRVSLWNGHPVDIDQLVATAELKYGKHFVPRVSHSLALSCMMAKRHDLARPLLQDNIQQCNPGSPLWNKSVWALARMESLLGNHAMAAGLYRQFFEDNSIPARFRLQAQLLWCQELIAAGQPGPLLEARSLMEATLSHVKDPEILMNFARQLQLGPTALRDWSKELFSQGEARALQCFHAANHPSVAVKILYKLTRRQLYDFDRPVEALRLWESLNPAKKEWLWSPQNSYWEYMGLLFDAHTRAEASQTGESFARLLLDDPATPSEGLACVGIPYGQWLIRERRIQDAQNLFDRLIRAAPNHPLCANAYYWKALAAYIAGDFKTMENYVGCLRRAQGNSLGVLDKWDIDAKALLLLAGLKVDAAALQIKGYTHARLHYLRSEIIREIGLLS